MEPEKTPRERAEYLISLLVADWRPTTRQGLWAIRGAIVLGALIAIGYAYGITLWEWAKLLIVPAAIAGAGLWFTQQQRERETQVADQRAQTDREIADQQRQDDMLQAYLDGMSQLLTDKERPLHRAQSGDSLSTVARARTLTALRRLDSERKGSVVQFLYESGLIDKERLIVDLRGADLRQAKLRQANLNSANLASADLSQANLQSADLTEADLSDSDLLEANLTWAKLQWANLSDARLSKAHISWVNVSWANLREVKGVNNEELNQQARFIEGATMPNGQKYGDWLKDREKRQQDE